LRLIIAQNLVGIGCCLQRRGHLFSLNWILDGSPKNQSNYIFFFTFYPSWDMVVSEVYRGNPNRPKLDNFNSF
jgi:hypothetical protein